METSPGCRARTVSSCSARPLQAGHWKSENSTMVTGAAGLPILRPASAKRVQFRSAVGFSTVPDGRGGKNSRLTSIAVTVRAQSAMTATAAFNKASFFTVDVALEGADRGRVAVLRVPATDAGTRCFLRQVRTGFVSSSHFTISYPGHFQVPVHHMPLHSHLARQQSAGSPFGGVQLEL